MKRTFLIITLLTTLPLIMGATVPRHQPDEHYKGRKIEKLDLEHEMTKSEFRNTGMESLSSTERRNLERWMTDWLRDQVKAEISDVILIRFIDPREGLITLEDGSKWKVDRFDIGSLKRWLNKDRVRMERGTPYKMVNLTRRQSVKVDVVSGKGVSGKENVHQIQQISSGGAIITLDDGSMWRVQLVDKSKSRSWVPRHEIEVTTATLGRRSQQELYNRDLRESVKAGIIRGPQVQDLLPEEEEKETYLEIEDNDS